MYPSNLLFRQPELQVDLKGFTGFRVLWRCGEGLLGHHGFCKGTTVDDINPAFPKIRNIP